MTDSTKSPAARAGPPTLEISPSALESQQNSAAASTAHSSSPSSLAPPESSLSDTGSILDLSRPGSPRRMGDASAGLFNPIPSTRDMPVTESPASYGNNLVCPRTGSLISTSPGFCAQCVPLGTRLYAHKPPEEDLRRNLANRKRIETTKWAKNTEGIMSIVTSGPTVMIGRKPCVLIPTPIREKQWLETSQAIVKSYRKQNNPANGKKVPEMKFASGAKLDPLREYGTSKLRANSIVDALNKSVTGSIVNLHEVGPVNVGRVWLCNLQCEGATGRKRDWALVELDPNKVGEQERRNVVVIEGRRVVLKAPTSRGARKGTKVVLITSRSQTKAVMGTIADGPEECIFGYHTLQRIHLEEGASLRQGDAGACVVDAETGVYHGMLVMAGNPEDLTKPTAWFVPWKVVVQDIGGSYPIEEVSLGD